MNTQANKAIIWPPFTQVNIAAPSIHVTKAKGSYIYDTDNNRYLDLISSWWVNLHGHAHPKIAKAIYDQAKELEHVIFAGFSHTPAQNLCEALQDILPSTLNYFFFSDNGSTAVEVAIKMAYQYWVNKGARRNKFLSFAGGYHGDTLAAMSVSQSSGFHDAFQPLFLSVESIPYPDTWFNDYSVISREQDSLSKLRSYLNQHHKNIAAFIAEPLIQGASGMRVSRSEYLKQVVELVRSYGILIIFDEVMTGFGRTGTIFAMEQVGCIPDFICLSKGLTGGFLPLALTVTTRDIYEAYLSNDIKTAFLHGHSYTANPLGCAAALASLQLLRSDKTMNAIQQINKTHLKYLPNLADSCNLVHKLRIQGTIAAFDLNISCTKTIQHLKRQFLKDGLLLRPLSNTVYILPPYSITEEELKNSYFKMEKIINEVNT